MVAAAARLSVADDGAAFEEMENLRSNAAESVVFEGFESAVDFVIADSASVVDSE